MIIIYVYTIFAIVFFQLYNFFNNMISHMNAMQTTAEDGERERERERTSFTTFTLFCFCMFQLYNFFNNMISHMNDMQTTAEDGTKALAAIPGFARPITSECKINPPYILDG